MQNVAQSKINTPAHIHNDTPFTCNSSSQKHGIKQLLYLYCDHRQENNDSHYISGLIQDCVKLQLTIISHSVIHSSIQLFVFKSQSTGKGCCDQGCNSWMACFIRPFSLQLGCRSCQMQVLSFEKMGLKNIWQFDLGLSEKAKKKNMRNS